MLRRWMRRSNGGVMLPLALALTVLASSGAAAEGLELPELAARTTPSVVRLEVKDSLSGELGSGTGFFVTSGGWVVTNHHVVEGASKVTVKTSDRRTLEARGIVASDPDNDVAILAVEQGRYPALALAGARRVRPGDEVVVVGSPLGLSGTLTAGIVSAVRDTETGRALEIDGERLPAWGLQFSAAISPGSSGSPVLTRDGEVIGVAVGTATAGQNINFGVPVKAVRHLLDTTPRDTEPRPFAGGASGGVLLNLGISAVVFGLLVMLYYWWTRRERTGKPTSRFIKA